MPYHVLQIVVVGLLFHSLYLRPLRTNAIFALLVYPPSAFYGDGTYLFTSADTSAAIGGWPLMNFLGFLFTFYVALGLCVSGMRRLYGRRIPMVPLALSIIVFVGLFGTMMELLNEYMRWWAFVRPVGKVEYFFLWVWRPMFSIPLFVALMIDNPRTRRRATAVTAVFLAVFFGLGIAMLMTWVRVVPRVFFFSSIPFFWVGIPLLVQWLHRRGVWDLSVPIEALQFDRPVPFGARGRGSDTAPPD